MINIALILLAALNVVFLTFSDIHHLWVTIGCLINGITFFLTGSNMATDKHIKQLSKMNDDLNMIISNHVRGSNDKNR